MNGRALHYFALLTSLATLALLGVGGLVTSHGVGMAVPDWPNTYGYNMFFFPVSQWVGGIFYEHTHRLVASGVGLLTGILALWLYGRTARPFMRWSGLTLLFLGSATSLAFARHWADGLVLGITGTALFGASFVWPRCEPNQRWLRRCGVVAFLAVVLQGVLGGLRVVLYRDAIGIFHATLAQLFFVLICAIALFTSRWWHNLPAPAASRADVRLTCFFTATTVLILAQLVLGATMRHQHAGLAIPDFPLAYGKVWPAIDAASVEQYNQQRMEILSVNPITALQIVLQMAHRMFALLILAAVAGSAWSACKQLGKENFSSKLALAWLVLIFAQVLLGAGTIWSNKAADIATAHVLIGALSLAAGSFLSIVSLRNLIPARRLTESSSVARALPPSPFVAPGASGVR